MNTGLSPNKFSENYSNIYGQVLGTTALEKSGCVFNFYKCRYLSANEVIDPNS